MSTKISGITTKTHKALQFEAAMFRQSLSDLQGIHEAPLLEAIAWQPVPQALAEQEREVELEGVVAAQKQERRFVEKSCFPILVVRVGCLRHRGAHQLIEPGEETTPSHGEFRPSAYLLVRYAVHGLCSGAPVYQEFWFHVNHGREAAAEKARIHGAMHCGKFDCAIQGYIDSCRLQI